MNRMRLIAEMFGKNLGETFKVKTERRGILNVRFTRKGVQFWHETYDEWLDSLGLLYDLIIGDAKIIG